MTTQQVERVGQAEVIRPIEQAATAVRAANELAARAERASRAAERAAAQAGRVDQRAQAIAGSVGQATARAVQDARGLAARASANADLLREQAVAAWQQAVESTTAMLPPGRWRPDEGGRSEAGAPERWVDPPYDPADGAEWVGELEVRARAAMDYAEHERHEAALAEQDLRDRVAGDRQAAERVAREARERADRSRQAADRAFRDAQRALGWLAQTASVQRLVDMLRIIVMVQELELTRTAQPGQAEVPDEPAAGERRLDVVEVTEADGSPLPSARLRIVRDALRAIGIDLPPSSPEASPSAATRRIAYAPDASPRRV